MRRHGLLITLMMVASGLAGCGSMPDPVLGEDTVRLGDEYLYRSGAGGWLFQVLVGPSVTVRDLSGRAHEAFALRLSATDGVETAPGETVYVLRDSGSVFAGLLGCTTTDPQLTDCVDLRSLVFPGAGALPPLLLGAAKYADAMALPQIAYGDGAPYAVVHAPSDPRWGQCLSLERDEPAPGGAGYGSLSWMAPIAMTLCSGAPVPTLIRLPAQPLLHLDAYVRGSGEAAIRGASVGATDMALDAFDAAATLPPQGEPKGAFTIHEAYEQARATDLAFAKYLREHPDAILFQSMETHRTTATLTQNLTRIDRYIRILEIGPPGSTNIFSVEIEKTLVNDSPPLYQVLSSAPAVAQTPVPSGLPRQLLTLGEGADVASTFMPSAFLSMTARGWMPDFGHARIPLENRYHYEYFFEGVEAKGAIFVASAVFDAADGRLLVVRAPSAALERFVPMDIGSLTPAP